MKKFLIVILLLLFTTPAMALDKCMLGSWYDPDRSGEGINLQVVGEITVIHFYTFNYNDDETWFILLGDRIFTMSSLVKIPDDDEFLTKEKLVGHAEIEYVSNNAIYFQFKQDLIYENGRAYECNHETCEGRFLYKRSTEPSIPCE